MSVEDYVVIGRIGKPHGIKGEVSVEPRTDEPDRRFAVGTVLRVERNRPGATRPRANPHGGTESAGTRAGCWSRSTRSPTATPPRSARGTVLVVPVDPG